jgi:hypothetical protein
MVKETSDSSARFPAAISVSMSAKTCCSTKPSSMGAPELGQWAIDNGCMMKGLSSGYWVWREPVKQVVHHTMTICTSIIKWIQYHLQAAQQNLVKSIGMCPQIAYDQKL